MSENFVVSFCCDNSRFHTWVKFKGANCLEYHYGLNADHKIHIFSKEHEFGYTYQVGRIQTTFQNLSSIMTNLCGVYIFNREAYDVTRYNCRTFMHFILKSLYDVDLSQHFKSFGLGCGVGHCSIVDIWTLLMKDSVQYHQEYTQPPEVCMVESYAPRCLFTQICEKKTKE